MDDPVPMDALKELEQWIAENGGSTDPSLSVSHGPRGRGIFTSHALKVNPTPLCRLPWRLLITEDLAEKSLAFGPDLRMAAEEFSAAPGLLLISAFLLQEKAHENSNGFHKPYYQVLPQVARLPACWPEHHWLHSSIKGSHLERQVRAKRHGLGLEFSLLQSFAEVTWEDFLWARCIVASRAYALCGQRCLVPWADLLNHATSSEVSARYQVEGPGSDFVMTLTKDVAKDAEVLQSYGEKTNAAYFLDYGFVLPKAPISASVSVTISMHIPDTDPEVAAKKELWKSHGGRGRETVMELSPSNFDQHLQLQRAAVLCSQSGLNEVDVMDMARKRCQASVEQMLERSRARIPKKEEGQLQDWELVAKQACAQILEEERAVLQDFWSWLSV